MPLSVDVVVPVLGRWDLTQACLGSLAAQELPHTVTVVDGGSTDGTPANVRTEFPDAAVIELAGNPGYSIACNTGAARGHADVVVFVNNDAACRPGCLAAMVAAFEANAGLGSVASVSLRPDGTIDACGITIDPTLGSFDRLSGRPTADARAASPRLCGPGGAAAAYRRAAFDDVGGFDPRLHFYFSDTDLAIRLAAAGWGADLAADATCVHVGSATAGRRSRFSRDSSGWGRGYVLRRYGILRGPKIVRTLATEALVVAGEVVLSRDLLALTSRMRGWRAAAGLPRLAVPASALDPSIGFAESMRMRWRER